jgi:hypothetical protein
MGVPLPPDTVVQVSDVPGLTLEQQLMLVLALVLYVGLIKLIKGVNEATKELDEDDE